MSQYSSLRHCTGQAPQSLPIPVEVSARHVHLSQMDIDRLFGTGYQLTPKRPLSQPGQFLCQEQVDLVTDKGSLHRVAILGPARSHTQVELSRTDAYLLGLPAPLRHSGDTQGCASVRLCSHHGTIWAEQAAMVVQAHIHMTPANAARYGVSDGQAVRVSMQTRRPLTFDHVLVRVSGDFSLAMHIDWDEANACGLEHGDIGHLIL